MHQAENELIPVLAEKGTSFLWWSQGIEQRQPASFPVETMTAAKAVIHMENEEKTDEAPSAILTEKVAIARNPIFHGWNQAKRPRLSCAQW